jgi:predicted TIM-barrel fold metal-dependent hydrolase
MNRRAFLAVSAAAAAQAQQRPPTVDAHIHLFSPDQEIFPYHPNAVYQPEPASLAGYLPFVAEAGIDGVIIVHPEPYQDDHTYLEYCFKAEPSEMFFKGTCLFDPTDASTPDRMAELVERNPERIVALRIHITRERDAAPTNEGPIRDRDLTKRQVRDTIRAAHKLGLAIQFHMIPAHAATVHFLAAEFSQTVIVIDHLARSGFGTPAEFAQVMDMATLPNVYMKFSGVGYSSRQDYPYRDTRALVRDVFEAFGPDRILWGGLGKTISDFNLQSELLKETFAFTSAANIAKIRGGNAMRLWWG